MLGVCVRARSTGYMYEKYDATELGKGGGGGEYGVQIGFGWTNGVLLSLFKQYGLVLTPPKNHTLLEPPAMPLEEAATFAQLRARLAGSGRGRGGSGGSTRLA